MKFRLNRVTVEVLKRQIRSLIIILSIFSTPQALAMDVDQLIEHIDGLWRGETSKAQMSMTVKTQRYERTMTMQAYSLGQEYSLIVIRKPKKDKDIATLKVEQNIWNYLPKINRVTKVPSSMMSSSWMGSHFSNDDLVKESTFVQDYDSEITFTGEREGKLIYEITSIPLPDAPVVWGKVIMLIDQDTLAPIQIKYYDEQQELIRTMTFDRLEKIDDKIVPLLLHLQPHDKPDESTVVTYDEIEFGVALDKSFFSLKNLKTRR